MLANSSAGNTPASIVNTDELLAAAVSCHARGDNLNAESLYRTILAANPRYLSALNNLGLLLSRRGLHQEAAELLATAISIRSDYADAHYNLGNAFLGLQQTEAAIEAFSAALRCDPAFAAAHLGLAAIYEFRGQLDATLRHYEEAIGCNPSLPDAYLGMGTAYQSKGDLGNARLCYLHAAACAPHMTAALAKIASLAPMGPSIVLPEAIAEIELCLRAGDMRVAIEYTEKLQALFPDNPEVLLMKGELFYRQGNTDIATDHFSLAVIHGQFKDRYITRYQEHAARIQAGRNVARPLCSTDYASFFRRAHEEGKLVKFRPQLEPKVNWGAIRRMKDMFRLSVFFDYNLLEKGLYLVKDVEADVFLTPKLHSLLVSKHHFLVEKTQEIPSAGPEQRQHIRLVKQDLWPCMEHGPYNGHFGAIFLPPEESITIEEPAIYIGGSSNYGHLLMDFLPKLLGPIQLGLTSGRKAFTYSAVCPPAAGVRMPPQMEAAEWLFPEIEFADLAVHGPAAKMVRFKSAIIPSYVPHAVGFAYLNERATAALERYSNPPEPRSKIYVTRGPLKRVANEEEIIEYVLSEGFDVVNPFEMSFIEQLHMYRNANVIMSCFGSQAVNRIFSRPGSHYIELVPSSINASSWWRYHTSIHANTRLNSVLITGHDIQAQGIMPDGSPVEVLSEFPVKELRELAGIWKYH